MFLHSTRVAIQNNLSSSEDKHGRKRWRRAVNSRGILFTEICGCLDGVDQMTWRARKLPTGFRITFTTMLQVMQKQMKAVLFHPFSQKGKENIRCQLILPLIISEQVSGKCVVISIKIWNWTDIKRLHGSPMNMVIIIIILDRGSLTTLFLCLSQFWIS